MKRLIALLLVCAMAAAFMETYTGGMELVEQGLPYHAEYENGFMIRKHMTSPSKRQLLYHAHFGGD
jgi:hypothetical protein